MNWPDEVRHDPHAAAQLASELSGEDLDTTTARLYRDLVRSERFCRLTSGAERVPKAMWRDVCVVLMPGAFHREHTHTGANGRRVIELVTAMGGRIETVNIGSFDRLHINAARLNEHLRRTHGSRVILISLSKGSADVKIALGLDPQAFTAVHTWISFSGILSGTPLIDWLQRRRLRWLGVRFMLLWKRLSLDALLELHHGPDGPLQLWPAMPPHLRLIQVLGCPQRRHLQHPWALRGYDRLSQHGPNDGGGNLLADAWRHPGDIYPVWGADHYLQPAWDIRPLLLSLMRTALDHANASAPAASPTPANKSMA